MEMKKEKHKGFRELKNLAAEKLLRIASNKLFIDIRKVRRFRIWQSEYLNHVMHGIAVKDSEKQYNLKRKYLQFLNFLLLKHLQKALYKWSSKVKILRIFNLPSSKFVSALKIMSVLLKWDNFYISGKDFPLFYIKSNAWKPSRIKIALFKWKEKVISALLNESHKEMGIIRINHFLHKKTTPLISFAIRKICVKNGFKVGCNVLLVILKNFIFFRKHFGFTSLWNKSYNHLWLFENLT